MIKRTTSIHLLFLLPLFTLGLSACGSSTQQAESWNSYYYGSGGGTDNDSNYTLPAGNWDDTEMYHRMQGY